jgi:hypothetical protein
MPLGKPRLSSVDEQRKARREYWAAYWASFERWQPCFVVWPVDLVSGERVSLRFLERRIKGGKVRFDDDGLIRLYEYRWPERRRCGGLL